MAWLEAALLSIVLALFISNTISIFMSKGVVPMLARAVLNKQAGPSATFEEEETGGGFAGRGRGLHGHVPAGRQGAADA